MQAVCSAARRDSTADPWKRFGDTIPIADGGWVFVLRGTRSQVDAALAPFGLASVASVECPDALVTLWVPGAFGAGGPDAATPFDAAFAAHGLRVIERLVFSAADGRRWFEASCADPEACCRQAILKCRFTAKTADDVRACLDKAREFFDGAPCP